MGGNGGWFAGGRAGIKRKYEGGIGVKGRREEICWL